ncbi:MAG: hypothetical protein AAGI03_02985, partial [Pseudomonadota bacterium]
MKPIHALAATAAFGILLAGARGISGSDMASAQTETEVTEAAASPAEAPAAIERIEMGNLVMENIPDIPADVSERLRQYQNVRGHGFSDWIGDDILIATRFGEVSQIHRVDDP